MAQRSDEGIDYRDDRSCIIFADSPAGRQRWHSATVGAAVRVIAEGEVEAAAAILADRVDPDLLLLDLTHEGGAGLDQLLARIAAAAVDGRSRALIAFTPDLIDRVAAERWAPEIELLCAASPLERAAAVGIAAGASPLWVLREHGDGSTGQLRQLSEEIGRIARTLAELSREAPAAPLRRPAAEPAVPPALPSVATLRAVIRRRRLRDHYFDADLFADPAWDMLLDLLLAHLERRTVAVSSLCIAASVPPTTALRWIKRLTEEGLFVRAADPRDGRRVFIELAPAAVEALAGYFRAIERIPAG